MEGYARVAARSKATFLAGGRGGHLMDIEKLIEQLKSAAGGPEGIKMCHAAATALSTLQAENEKLRAELCRELDAAKEAVQDVKDTL